MKLLHRIVIACLLALPFISYVQNSTPDKHATTDMMLLAENRYKQNTYFVKDATPRDIPSNASFFFDANGTLFFRGSDGSNEGLWTSDGTEKGTVFIRNIDQDTDSSHPGTVIRMNDPFFSANDKPFHR